ncbi:MAG: type II secretion system protein [Candidatus Dependentiae bacterium]|nr:type II secretion system protein [Candidatus Dependentiae bacterium]
MSKQELFPGLKGNRTQGFLLIELMAALALLSGATVISAYFYAQIATWHHEARRYLEATTLAGSVLEKAMIEGVMPKKQGIEKEPFIVSWHTQSLKDAQKGMEHFTIVEVDVTWQTMAGNKKSVTIVSGLPLHKESL